VNGAKIHMSGKGHVASEGKTMGDVVVVVVIEKHPVFTRNGPDLYVEKTISLADALCGFHFTIRHINGNMLQVDSDVIRSPGTTQKIEGHGIIPGGVLYIKYQVQFPSTLSKEARKTVRSILS
jgi:DnaJ family protein A protein 2